MTQSDLMQMLLPVRHGDAITITYHDDDASTVSKSATADLEGPVVTLESPTEKYLSEGLVTLSATAQDADSGVNEDELELVTPPDFGAPLTIPIVVDKRVVGYTLSRSATEPLDQGEHKWYVTAEDNVGNTPDTTKAGASLTKAFTFFVDDTGPELRRTGIGGETGVTLKNAGVTEGNNKETEKADAQWVRIDLDLGSWHGSAGSLQRPGK